MGAPRVGVPMGSDYLPREVFFFFGVTVFPAAAACFCFFFAGISTSLSSRPTRT
jgi:hypothetical protein